MALFRIGNSTGEGNLKLEVDQPQYPKCYLVHYLLTTAQLSTCVAVLFA